MNKQERDGWREIAYLRLNPVPATPDGKRQKAAAHERMGTRAAAEWMIWLLDRVSELEDMNAKLTGQVQKALRHRDEAGLREAP